MTVTTIFAVVFSALCYIGQIARIRVNEYYELLEDQQKEEYPDLFSTELPAYKMQTQFNEEFSYWMMIPIFLAFLAILLFMIVAIWEQYHLNRIRGTITYLLLTVTLVIPGTGFIGMLAFKWGTNAYVLMLSGSIVMGVILLILLIILRISDWPASAPSPMLSPWIGIPGYIATFFWCSIPFASGAYDVYDPGGVVEALIMTVFLGVTVLLMIADTALYRHMLKNSRKIDNNASPCFTCALRAGFLWAIIGNLHIIRLKMEVFFSPIILDPPKDTA